MTTLERVEGIIEICVSPVVVLEQLLMGSSPEIKCTVIGTLIFSMHILAYIMNKLAETITHINSMIFAAPVIGIWTKFTTRA
jgi:hypothetical protein